MGGFIAFSPRLTGLVFCPADGLLLLNGWLMRRPAVWRLDIAPYDLLLN